MKVHVDPERCQGHTLCSMIAPDVFQLDEIDGHSTVVIDGDVTADLEAKVAEAVRSYPNRQSQSHSPGQGETDEAIIQLRGEAGERQVAGASVAAVSSGGLTPGGALLLRAAT